MGKSFQINRDVLSAVTSTLEHNLFVADSGVLRVCSCDTMDEVCFAVLCGRCCEMISVLCKLDSKFFTLGDLRDFSFHTLAISYCLSAASYESMLASAVLEVRRERVRSFLRGFDGQVEKSMEENTELVKSLTTSVKADARDLTFVRKERALTEIARLKQVPSCAGLRCRQVRCMLRTKSCLFTLIVMGVARGEARDEMDVVLLFISFFLSASAPDMLGQRLRSLQECLLSQQRWALSALVTLLQVFDGL